MNNEALQRAKDVFRRAEEILQDILTPEHRVYWEQLRDLAADAERLMEEKREACPCLHVTPCHPHCTCVEPFSSRGCTRCCSYGSPSQQKAMAEYFVATETQIVLLRRVANLAEKFRDQMHGAGVCTINRPQELLWCEELSYALEVVNQFRRQKEND